MKRLILTELENYSNSINKLEREMLQLEQTMLQKRNAIEQQKGAYSAIFKLAVAQGVIDEQGQIINDDSFQNDSETEVE